MSAGTFTVDAGANLLFDAGHYTLDGVIEGAGAVWFRNTASASVPGLYNIAGSTNFDFLGVPASAQASFAFTNVQSVGSELWSRNGHGTSISLFKDGSPVPLHLTTLTLNGPNLTTGPIDVTNFDWQGGALRGVGDIVVETLSMAGSMGMTVDGRTLNLISNGVYTGGPGNGHFHLINGAVFNNLGELEVRAPELLTPIRVDGDGIFNNPGTILRTTGPNNNLTGGWHVHVPFQNTGTVHVQGGHVTFLGGGMSAGTFTVDAGANLLFDAGHYTLDGVIEGAGGVAFRNTASASVSGMYNVTGITSFVDTGATTFDFTNAQSVGTELFISRALGTNINLFQNGTPVPLDLSKLTLDRAILTTGPIDMATFDWQGGTLSGVGDVNVAQTLMFSALHGNGTVTLNGRMLNNLGSAINSAPHVGQGNLHLINGAVFNNIGTVELQAPAAGAMRVDGDGAFNNSGTILRTTGPNNNLTGNWNVSVPFTNTNTGIVHIQGGGIVLLGGGTSTGTFMVDAGASLGFDNGLFTQTDGMLILNGGQVSTFNSFSILGGELLGSGTVSGNISNGGTVNPGFGPDSPELITINGNYNQGSSGALRIQIGGLANGFTAGGSREYDQLAVNGPVNLDGDLVVSLFGGFTPHLNDQFLIINNDGTDGVSGKFNSDTVEIGSIVFTVGYNGGDGNDVVLTVVRVDVNEQPVAINQSVSVTEDESTSITLSGSDAETAEENLTFQITSLPSSGSLSHQGIVLRQDDSGNIYIDDGLATPASFIGPPTLSYEPAIGCDHIGGDSFSFIVIDRGDPDGDPNGDAPLTSEPAVVTIQIVPTVTENDVIFDSSIVRIGGTSADDDIRITHTANGTSLLVTINGDVVSNDIPLNAVSEIRAWGRGGNDRIEIIDLAIDSLLDGGDGDDEIIGAAGRDLILGGDGNDLLTGASGDDFLIGGTGADRIVGSAGHDVLVAGSVACHFTNADLRLIALQWAANRTTDDGLEDEVLDETSDGFDMLTGSSGSDWFIISDGDKVTDFKLQNKDGDLVTTV
jgi:Ca2+-binding RTX toxin-like protein